MDSCLVDIEFVFNNIGEAFPQKATITGITKNKNIYVKEVFFNLPCKTEREQEQAEDQVSRFGDVEYSQKIRHLTDVISVFQNIFVKNRLQSDYMQYLLFDKRKIFIVGKK